jgi:hypothetical protein
MSIGCCVRRLSPARPGDLPAVAWAGAQASGNPFQSGIDDRGTRFCAPGADILANLEGD